MGMGDDDASHVRWCDTEASLGVDEDDLTRVVGPARVDQRHTVVPKDGVDVHHLQILQWQRERDHLGVGRQFVGLGDVGFDQVVVGHLG